MRKRYIAIDGHWVEVSKDYVPEPRTPLIMPDIKPYKSMIDGTEITSRSRHRDHLKAYGVVEVGDAWDKGVPQRQPQFKRSKEVLARLVHEKIRY